LKDLQFPPRRRRGGNKKASSGEFERLTVYPAIKEEQIMDKYVCTPCGYVYDPAVGDPDSGIAPGTPWEQVPDTWVCPICGVGKDMFEKE